MGPTITVVVVWIVTLIGQGLVGIPFFAENAEILQATLNGIQWLLIAAFTGFVIFLAGRKGWGNLMRVVQAVVAHIEVSKSEKPDPVKRQAAIDAILIALPSGKFGAQGILMRIPGVGQYLAGMLVDWLAGSAKNLLKTEPHTASTTKALEDAKAKARE